MTSSADTRDIARLALKSKYVFKTIRSICATGNAQLDRLYAYGAEGIPGSIIQAILPLIKRNPDLSDGDIAEIISGDSEKTALLEKNLEWERSNPRSSDAFGRFAELLLKEKGGST